ncbi:cell division protein FtsA [Peribacillus sp. SCS-155]|uniref:cell division protein FtsA n=1 Tax=Peribacillus sedimenti TaxID=3115297 RepID=UPI003905E90D
MQEKIFALDIGTRSVVGLVLEKRDDTYFVKDILAKEHTERAMMDGQIHDVISVSKVISEIKDGLEQIHGPLTEVCVAAAGRALKTERAAVTVDVRGKPIMQRDDILHLELSAVQQAQSLVAEKISGDASYHYYCVGYSVLYYRLDGEEIGNLIDQSGNEASVEIIATFLPKVVVESLLAALKRSNLTMSALTLEPIAAINVLIPPSMRRLNVALVDIGAGTSDIAITDTGTVIAYGMVPVAGDEITEAISDHLLLDFPMAEQAKRSLMNEQEITVTDILGFENSIARDEIVEQIFPALAGLAEAISKEIRALNNHKSPKAVMLVGGGSLTPKLPALLAEKLDLPQNRVAIRGIEAITNLSMSDHLPKGPELVTPVGIAIAAHNSPIQYMSVYVNGQLVRLFEMKKMTVGDCLLTAGIKIGKLYGRPGLAMIVNVNGQKITVPGSHGQKPTLLLNGIPAALDDDVKKDDQISVEKGVDGEPSVVKIEDLLDSLPQKKVYINDVEYFVSANLLKNGKPASGSDLVRDKDQISCHFPENIEELLISLQLNGFPATLSPFMVNVNGKTIILENFSAGIRKNEIPVTKSHGFENGDKIRIYGPANPKVSDLATLIQVPLTYSIQVTFNGNRTILTKNVGEFYRENKRLIETDELHNGDELSLIKHRIDPFIFQDIFKYVEIDKPTDSNGRFILFKNDKETSFNEIITSGDQLKLIWPGG